MDDNSNATDRIVVVGAGFGVWIDNRHIASARWGDVTEVRVRKHDAAHKEGVDLVVVLRDGAEVAIEYNLSGYQSFLAAAEASLAGMRQPSNPVPGETILFKRGHVRG